MNVGFIASRDGLNLVTIHYKVTFIEHIIITTIIGGVLYVAKNHVAMIKQSIKLQLGHVI